MMDEAYALLADLEGPDAASAAAATGRKRRLQRQRHEAAMLTREQAVAKADAHLQAEGSSLVADFDSALPNPKQHLWIVSYIDPRHPEEQLDGGGLVVPTNGDVYTISSGGSPEEMLGVEFPETPDTLLPEGWYEQLSHVYEEPWWDELMTFVGTDRIHHQVYPAPSDTFAALEFTPHADVRVVILGQDPYHGAGQADGLAFSVGYDAPLKPAGRRIRQLLCRDLGVHMTDLPPHGNLAGWARQGVLMLNTALTVRAGDPAGREHSRRWQPFTDAVIRAVNAKADRVVFMLWGNKAHNKERLITGEHHVVIKTAHPTHRPGVSVPFLDTHPFTEANVALKAAGPKTIAWERTG